MTAIFCSARLSKLLEIKNRLPSISLDNWNANMFSLEGRKCLVFVHKETFYSFVVFDVLKKDLNNFPKVFIDNFVQQLIQDDLLIADAESSIEKYFSKIELSTTDGDHSTIGFTNDCISRLTCPINGKKPSILKVKEYVDNHYNNNPLLTRGKVTPINLMKEILPKYLKH